MCIAELQIIMNAFDGPLIGENIEELNMQIEKWTRSIGKHIFATEILHILNNAHEIITNEILATETIGNKPIGNKVIANDDVLNNTRNSTKRKYKNNDDDDDDDD